MAEGTSISRKALSLVEVWAVGGMRWAECPFCKENAFVPSGKRTTPYTRLVARHIEQAHSDKLDPSDAR